MRDKGLYFEQLAKHYLQQQQLTCIAQNVHSKFGEIDLIMLEQTTYVFVEVKYRKQTHFGHAAEMVSYQKQQKIRKTAAFYLQQQALNAYNTPCRFDIVSIEGDANNPEIHWLKNAF